MALGSHVIFCKNRANARTVPTQNPPLCYIDTFVSCEHPLYTLGSSGGTKNTLGIWRDAKRRLDIWASSQEKMICYVKRACLSCQKSRRVLGGGAVGAYGNTLSRSRRTSKWVIQMYHRHGQIVLDIF